jgi:biopolymer transport protein ExbD
MLIFFIVTTSFVKEKGIEVSRPSNTPPKEVKKNKGPIVIKIDANGNITMKGRLLDRNAVEANLEREKAEKPDSPLIIAAHPEAQTDALVLILDAAEAVGVASVNVATTRNLNR